jgi:hypothetical protein
MTEEVAVALYFSTPYLKYEHGGRADFRDGCDSRNDSKFYAAK